MIVTNKQTGNWLEVNEFGAELFLRFKALFEKYGPYRAGLTTLAKALDTNTASLNYWLFGFWKVGLINKELKPGNKAYTYSIADLGGFEIDD
ncbi:hypothetical protein [Pantoea sp. ME81]|uniref:hypothetical protein n=1 Tax=Pantoea sp. ME81 TaxID=2743935 RepID=UPI0015F4B139|nr:hypothetical protein [Pantoea sp. ME81]